MLRVCVGIILLTMTGPRLTLPWLLVLVGVHAALCTVFHPHDLAQSQLSLAHDGLPLLRNS